MNNPIFKVKEEKQEKTYAQFVIEPLEPGYGHTLGVALRRVLLSNIEGAAVTSVKIDGVKHMFSTLPGLKEDIIELILNIKKLEIKLAKGKEEAKIHLSKKGPGNITAADIEVSDGVEIVDKDHYLGSLSDKNSKIEIEMTVQKGMGYSLAEERQISTVGVIPIDAIFSPIVKVNYKVEQTRVGRETNYDKLVFEMWTDGTINAKEALEDSARMLVSYFSQVFEQKDTNEEKVENEEETSQIPSEISKMTVDELDLPTRIYNSLRNAGIETVGQLLETPRKELMAYRNLGAKSLAIIQENLSTKGITFEF